jgi:hypothetical protein
MNGHQYCETWEHEIGRPEAAALVSINGRSFWPHLIPMCASCTLMVLSGVRTRVGRINYVVEPARRYQ